MLSLVKAKGNRDAVLDDNITRLRQDQVYISLQKDKIVIRKVVALFLYNKTRLG